MKKNETINKEEAIQLILNSFSEGNYLGWCTPSDPCLTMNEYAEAQGYEPWEIDKVRGNFGEVICVEGLFVVLQHRSERIDNKSCYDWWQFKIIDENFSALQEGSSEEIETPNGYYEELPVPLIMVEEIISSISSY